MGNLQGKPLDITLQGHKKIAFSHHGATPNKEIRESNAEGPLYN